jgi:malate/lactate dehydrogenase
MSLERVGVVGAGNVGSAVVMELARQEGIADQIVVTSRMASAATAAVLDAASAFPVSAAEHIRTAGKLRGSFDAVIITAGVQTGDVVSDEVMVELDAQIAYKALADVETKHVILVGSPVDRLTEQVADVAGYAVGSVIGFGGELDRARLHQALLKRGLTTPAGTFYAVGEHGPRVVPVYPDETSYDQIQADIGTVLSEIKKAGRARNLATGVHIARLLHALGGDGDQIHCVSVPSEDFYDLSITWPHVITTEGATSPLDITVGPRANQLLHDLVSTRLSEREDANSS